MKIHVYLLCYNELPLLRRTVAHYRSMLGNPDITVVDNMSTDGCNVVAETELGCTVVQWSSGNYLNEIAITRIKNKEWTLNRDADWVIICDMDEWLDATAVDLQQEALAGTTILRTEGFEVVAASKTEDASDLGTMVRLASGYPRADMAKAICFNPRAIERINYSFGAHKCNPTGRVQWSETPYRLRHMNTLGLRYCTRKHEVRYARAVHMRRLGLAVHYLSDADAVRRAYEEAVRLAEEAGCAVAVVDNAEVDQGAT